MGVIIVIVNHITSMPTYLHEVLPRFTSMSWPAGPQSALADGLPVRRLVE